MLDDMELDVSGALELQLRGETIEIELPPGWTALSQEEVSRISRFPDARFRIIAVSQDGRMFVTGDGATRRLNDDSVDEIDDEGEHVVMRSHVRSALRMIADSVIIASPNYSDEDQAR